MSKSKKLTIDEFYKFADKIARRDKWFIGSFLGRVYEEWQEKHPKKSRKKRRK